MNPFHDRSILGYLIAALILAPTSALLASTHLSSLPNRIAQQSDCTNPQTQSEMNICAGQSWQRSDRALNRIYQALLPNLSESRRQSLITAQLKWIRFRDAECAFAGSSAEGGTMQPMLIAGCNDQITQQRIADLRAYQRGGPAPAKSNSYQSADRRLNQTYQQLRQQLQPERKQKLESAELAWIGFRDSSCEFEAGSGGSAARNQCLTRMTEQRSRQLSDYLQLLR